MSDSLPEARPTHIRHVVVAVSVLMSILLYLDRFCVSFAERYIKEDLGLTDSQMAWFLSLFFLSYALAQVPAGWLSDRFGGRITLGLYILTWSAFTAFIGVAAGFLSLIVMRLGCGLGQAGAYPASGSLLSKWVPLSNRGFASALVGLGGRIGGAIAPVLTAYLMVAFVPISTAALLDKSHLLDPAGLFRKLENALTSTPSASGGTVSPAVRRIADMLPRDAELRILGFESLTQSSQTESPSEPINETALLSSLNEVLRSNDLYQEEAFGKLNIEREALGFLRRRADGGSLSEAETIRLNRLILEAVFPTEIGKLYVQGWRPVVIWYGIAGVAVAFVFWFFFRDTPRDHPWCNAAERDLIDFGKPASTVQPAKEPFPVGPILRSRSLWLSSISQFGTNVAWLFFVTWLPRYLIEVHHVPILERSWMTSIPALAGILGLFLGGQLIDRLTKRIGLRWGRALPMGLTRFGAAASYLACLAIPLPPVAAFLKDAGIEPAWAATACFALGFFFVDLGVSGVWAFVQDVGGKNVGSILGWGNMFGNLGAFVAPHIYNAVLGKSPEIKDWNAMFLVCAGMFVISGVAALGIDATKSIAADDGNHS